MRENIDINSNDNALFVTSQCNNRCIMCCQPPLKRDDLDFYFQKNITLIDSAPQELPSIGITGGEPTLLGDRLIELIAYIRYKLPNTEIHILSNGRAFADRQYVERMATCGSTNILIGIPLHSDNARDHDRITQVEGSYNETMSGLYNLARFNFGVELRVVLNRMNIMRLGRLPNFFYRNLPFVQYISLMGLEYTGYTIKNRERVWIDPVCYQDELEEAVLGLAGWDMNVSVFNLPHCLLRSSIWGYAKKSISDWKVIFTPSCATCSVKAACCGLFGTSQRQSSAIHPL